MAGALTPNDGIGWSLRHVGWEGEVGIAGNVTQQNNSNYLAVGVEDWATRIAAGSRGIDLHQIGAKFTSRILAILLLCAFQVADDALKRPNRQGL